MERLSFIVLAAMIFVMVTQITTFLLNYDHKLFLPSLIQSYSGDCSVLSLIASFKMLYWRQHHNDSPNPANQVGRVKFLVNPEQNIIGINQFPAKTNHLFFDIPPAPKIPSYDFRISHHKQVIIKRMQPIVSHGSVKITAWKKLKSKPKLNVKFHRPHYKKKNSYSESDSSYESISSNYHHSKSLKKRRPKREIVQYPAKKSNNPKSPATEQPDYNKQEMLKEIDGLTKVILSSQFQNFTEQILAMKKQTADKNFQKLLKEINKIRLRIIQNATISSKSASILKDLKSLINIEENTTTNSTIKQPNIKPISLSHKNPLKNKIAISNAAIKPTNLTGKPSGTPLSKPTSEVAQKLISKQTDKPSGQTIGKLPSKSVGQPTTNRKFSSFNSTDIDEALISELFSIIELTFPINNTIPSNQTVPNQIIPKPSHITKIAQQKHSLNAKISKSNLPPKTDPGKLEQSQSFRKKRLQTEIDKLAQIVMTQQFYNLTKHMIAEMNQTTENKFYKLLLENLQNMHKKNLTVNKIPETPNSLKLHKPPTEVTSCSSFEKFRSISVLKSLNSLINTEKTLHHHSNIGPQQNKPKSQVPKHFVNLTNDHNAIKPARFLSTMNSIEIDEVLISELVSIIELTLPKNETTALNQLASSIVNIQANHRTIDPKKTKASNNNDPVQANHRTIDPKKVKSLNNNDPVQANHRTIDPKKVKASNNNDPVQANHRTIDPNKVKASNKSDVKLKPNLNQTGNDPGNDPVVEKKSLGGKVSKSKRSIKDNNTKTVKSKGVIDPPNKIEKSTKQTKHLNEAQIKKNQTTKKTIAASIPKSKQRIVQDPSKTKTAANQNLPTKPINVMSKSVAPHTLIGTMKPNATLVANAASQNSSNEDSVLLRNLFSIIKLTIPKNATISQAPPPKTLTPKNNPKTGITSKAQQQSKIKMKSSEPNAAEGKHKNAKSNSKKMSNAKKEISRSKVNNNKVITSSKIKQKTKDPKSKKILSGKTKKTGQVIKSQNKASIGPKNTVKNNLSKSNQQSKISAKKKHETNGKIHSSKSKHAKTSSVKKMTSIIKENKDTGKSNTDNKSKKKISKNMSQFKGSATKLPPKNGGKANFSKSHHQSKLPMKNGKSKSGENRKNNKTNEISTKEKPLSGKEKQKNPVTNSKINSTAKLSQTKNRSKETSQFKKPLSNASQKKSVRKKIKPDSKTLQNGKNITPTTTPIKPVVQHETSPTSKIVNNAAIISKSTFKNTSKRKQSSNIKISQPKLVSSTPHKLSISRGKKSSINPPTKVTSNKPQTKPIISVKLSVPILKSIIAPIIEQSKKSIPNNRPVIINSTRPKLNSDPVVVSKQKPTVNTNPSQTSNTPVPTTPAPTPRTTRSPFSYTWGFPGIPSSKLTNNQLILRAISEEDF